MATVSDAPRSRGQLILLGGLVLATLLVGLVVVLNAAVYTESLASRDDTGAADDALRYRAEAEAAAAGLASPGVTETEVRNAMNDWSETTALQYARNGAETSVSVESVSPVRLRVTYQTERLYYESEFTVTL